MLPVQLLSAGGSFTLLVCVATVFFSFVTSKTSESKKERKEINKKQDVKRYGGDTALCAQGREQRFH